MARKRIAENHIVNIVQNEQVREQGDLQELLRLRGYDVPQATLSRTLKKLNIAKIDGIYKIIDFGSTSLPVVLNMQISDFGIIVLHTHPGNAHSLAYFIDQKYVSYAQDVSNKIILGTIAGDDTVMIVVKNKNALKEVITIFQALFPYLKVNA